LGVETLRAPAYAALAEPDLLGASQEVTLNRGTPDGSGQTV